MNYYCYWLLPSEDDKKYLQDIVDQLAKKYTAPSFVPHLTLYAPTQIEKEKATEFIKDAASGIRPFHIQKKRIFYTKQFFKTVIIEFEMNEELRIMSTRLQDTLSSYTPYEFNPHISLLYKEMPLEEKQAIGDALNVKETYQVDTIALLEMGPAEEDIYNIDDWKIVFTEELKS